MVTWMWAILSSTSNKYSSIISLNRTKSNGYVKVYIQKFSCFLININIIEGKDTLIKLKEVDFISPFFIVIPY